MIKSKVISAFLFLGAAYAIAPSTAEAFDIEFTITKGDGYDEKSPIRSINYKGVKAVEDQKIEEESMMRSLWWGGSYEKVAKKTIHVSPREEDGNSLGLRLFYESLGSSRNHILANKASFIPFYCEEVFGDAPYKGKLSKIEITVYKTFASISSNYEWTKSN